MSELPKDLLYTKEHEWVRINGKRATVGITDFAQEELGDVVFVDLPEVGAKVEAGEAFGSVESVKAASDLFTPVGGSVLEMNHALIDAPELVNDSPYEEGWMILVEVEDDSLVDELMTAEEYEAFLEEE